MLCIEFPSASPADVRGPQAVDLCGAARALLGDCSPLKTPALAQTHTQTDTHTSWDPVANYMPITAFPPPPLFFSFQVKDTSYTKLFTCLLSLVLRHDL